MSQWPAHREPIRVNDPDDWNLAAFFTVEFQADDSPEAVKELDQETALLFAWKLARVARAAGWAPNGGGGDRG